MSGLRLPELIIILVIFLIVYGVRQIFQDRFKGGGPYENCPVCGEKIGELLAVAKTL